MNRVWHSAAPVALSCLFLWGGCKTEISELNFETYDQLASAQEPGNWIPEFLPRSAVQIHLKYKVDTGAQMLVFQAERNDGSQVVRSCRKVAASNLELIPSGRFGTVDWWPKALVGDAPSEEELAEYDLFQCERQASLAVLRNEHRLHAFYWRVAYRGPGG